MAKGPGSDPAPYPCASDQACAAAKGFTAMILHHIDLTETREIAPGIMASRDSQGDMRLHTAARFLGYAHRWAETPDGSPRFHAHAWNVSGARKLNRYDYRTKAGAERALIRLAPQLIKV